VSGPNSPRVHQPLRMHLISLPGHRGLSAVTRAEIADPFRVGESGPQLRPSSVAAGLTLADDRDAADVWALPCHWQSLDDEGRRQARRCFDQAHAASKPIVVWTVGDLESALDHPAVIRFQLGGSRTRKSPAFGVHAYPPFIDDELGAREHGIVSTHPWTDRPRVGFCGQGRSRVPIEAKTLANKARTRLAHRTGPGDKRVGEPWTSHLRLRQRALAHLQDHPKVAADFVIHDSYRAGLRSKADRRDTDHPTRVQFFENLRTNDYALCVRGGGNFSIRLFEALCYGRVPIIVDSGGRLPLEDEIDWDSYSIRVPARRLHALGDLVSETHHRLGPAGLHRLQRECRNLWVARLCLDAYMADWPGILARNIANSPSSERADTPDRVAGMQ